MHTHAMDDLGNVLSDSEFDSGLEGVIPGNPSEDGDTLLVSVDFYFQKVSP